MKIQTIQNLYMFYVFNWFVGGEVCESGNWTKHERLKPLYINCMGNKYICN